ncbi:chitin disaccharide deacetylase [Helcococcus kunzii]
MLNRLIINADDFGYTEATNYGIVDAHKNGVLTSTTIMANMPGFDHAVKLSKLYPNLGIGVHLVLTCGKPLTDVGEGYLDANGEFKRSQYYFSRDDNSSLDAEWLDPDKVYIEWKTQIEKVINSGVKPTHLDSHHHMHTHEVLQPVVRKLSEEYNLPVRNCNKAFFNDKVKHFEERFDKFASQEKVDYKLLDKMLNEIKEKEITEIMSHPSYISKFLLENSSFNMGRIYELDVLTNDKFRDIIEKYNLELINYSDI